MKTMQMKIFQDSDINIGRQDFLDFAKTIAIFGMILIHVFTHSGIQISDISFVSFLIISLLGGVLAAPVFMFCMGIGIAYSKNSKPQQSFKRGIELTIKAWILNFIRFPLLLLILWNFVDSSTNLQDHIIYGLFTLDILHFAGLSFILFALFQKYKFSAKTILLIAIILAIIATLFRNFNTNSLVIDIIVGHFLGVSKTTYSLAAFPLFHWFIFVAGGYYFGGLLKRCNELNALFFRLFIVVLPLFIIYTFYGINSGTGMFSGDGDAYYHMTFVEMLYAFTAIFSMLSFAYFVAKFMSQKILNICSSVSKNIKEIYIQQWIYIAWFIVVPCDIIFGIKLSLAMVLVATIIIFIISAVLAELYKNIKTKRLLMQAKLKQSKVN